METKSKEKKTKYPSELRQDLVTGDWVVIATGRSKRPEDFFAEREEIERIEKDEDKKCFFCFPEETGQEKDVLIYANSEGDWSLRVFPNKYPALLRGKKINHWEEGPYFAMDGVGYHELVVTRDHEKSIGQLDVLAVAEIIDAYQDRYISLMNKKSVNYIDIFHNHGKSAGASIVHPHSQLVAIPVISPYVKAELDGAEIYYRQNKQCVYCAMISWEKEKKLRVVFENDEYLAFCPFSSRVAFEVWVIPKKHKPYFERTGKEEKIKVAEALQGVLEKIYKRLNNPDYNFYIHTSPCDGKDYPHFHWHIEILPKTSVWAGFELSTGVEISTIEPEESARYLREKML
ncbi:MAG: galactose-1-phosphate uridylyltransferase [Candidatus Moranbacteria bacterium CG_4_8_14_3_um_filter_34_16]|nr:MAG: galactose-1-phosphate uridylyltransferase [Candidatus Moranbacteria bacterium CG08_land_8_20_14_0_20_34_16]PIW94850.1 MAG: galactose-1-phosphate uridylyltransferase [Candidatus Moranbacteria bacterium CG_4_8_14_3_um_filter_34_16]PJA89149.1 MAG: galactose-1-phosphate uridylyltransferase [Candidatus Moranbacteria bacterium CG_4_9_14_3_um_filter_33_15]